MNALLKCQFKKLTFAAVLLTLSTVVGSTVVGIVFGGAL